MGIGSLEVINIRICSRAPGVTIKARPRYPQQPTSDFGTAQGTVLWAFMRSIILFWRPLGWWNRHMIPIFLLPIYWVPYNTRINWLDSSFYQDACRCQLVSDSGVIVMLLCIELAVLTVASHFYKPRLISQICGFLRSSSQANGARGVSRALWLAEEV